MVGIVITGAAGRMGRTLLRSALKTKDAVLLGGTVRPNSPLSGKDVGELVGQGRIGVGLTENLDAYRKVPCVVIDFTNIESSIETFSFFNKK